MSVLFRRPPRDVARAGQPAFTFNDWVRIAGGSSSISQSSVQSIEQALTSSVVWRCAMKNAATVATFPVHTKRDRKTIPDPQVVADPAGDGTLRSSWVFAVTVSMYLAGGASGFVRTAEGGTRPIGLHLLHPDRAEWTQRDGWTVDGKPEELWPVGKLWHCPMYVLPGSPKGLNPLQYARRSLFPGMAALDFGGNFFRDGAHPTSIIAPERDPGTEGAKALKARVMEAVSGSNREPIVLPQSVKWTQMQVNPEDSQFIELMRLTDEQVCRYMGTPPEEVGIAPGGSSLTYANREQRKQDYLQELLMPMRRIEEAWSSLIARPQVVKLNPAGLLQADLLARYQSYKTAADINALTGEVFLSVAEMRELEDRPPNQPTEATDA